MIEIIGEQREATPEEIREWEKITEEILKKRTTTNGQRQNPYRDGKDKRDYQERQY